MKKWIGWAAIIGVILLCMCFVWGIEGNYGKIIVRILVYCGIFGYKIFKDKIKSKMNKEEAEQQEKINTEITQSIKDGTFTPIQVDIPLEKEESTYGVYGTALIKEKKITTRTNFGGMTGSIKIMKGMRYRLGSIQHQSESHIEEYRADVGILYVTNKRFIFKGDKQVVEIKAKDMMTMEVTGNFVKIFKKKGNAIKLEFIGEHSTFGAVMTGLNNKE